jgi:SAM-dependent methyltransferase
VTISEAQVTLAREHVAAAGLADRCRFVLADFASLPPELGPVDAAYAIEALVHAPEPGRVLAEVARVLAPGGVLVVIDDVLAPDADPDDPVVARFRRGWHTAGLRTAAQVAELAAAAGLVVEADRDLTPLIRLWRPRDRLIHWLQPLLRLGAARSAWFQSLVGGDALQVGLHTGRLQHRWIQLAARP